MQWLTHADVAVVNGSDKDAGGKDNDFATILVVDDNADMRSYITRILAQNKAWNIIIASDGVEALEVVQHQKPQLILSDIMMPRMDGYGLLKKLKRGRRYGPDTSYFFISTGR